MGFQTQKLANVAAKGAKVAVIYKYSFLFSSFPTADFTHKQ
jgi:hypothetical protein